MSLKDIKNQIDDAIKNIPDVYRAGYNAGHNDMNVKNGYGVDSIQQNFDTKNWKPTNTHILEAINEKTGTADDGHTIDVDENGNVNVGAYGKHSVMTGGKSQNVGKKSFTAGSKNIAFESNSAAFGNETFAKGKHSFTQGNKTTASGNAAMATGQETEASGTQSFAGGIWSKAKGDYSAVLGVGTIAGGNDQLVHGRYNIEDNGKFAHIVGNGYVIRDEGGNIIETHRKNAYTLDWNGNVYYSGNGEYSGVILRSSTEGSSKKFLLTVNDSGNLSINEII